MTEATTIPVARRFRDPCVFVFSLTLLLSAGLMFMLQPMVGKMLLPLVGGAPSGWLVAMSFFQIALLAGYWLAHQMSKIPAFYHAAAVMILLGLGMLMLPVGMDGVIDHYPNLPEAARVFLALVMTLSVPFLALAVLSPSLQRLFSLSPSSQAHNPYFLFAASNLGSFGGLLAYPLLVEWFLGVHDQSQWWKVGYALLMIMCALSFVVAKPPTKNMVSADTTVAVVRPTMQVRLRWLLLAFISSSLMVGLTAHITTDVGGVPFFWVLPLGLYLLTFVVAFAGKPSPKLDALPYLQPIITALLVFVMIKQPLNIASGEVSVQMLLPLFVFVIAAMQCHYTLSKSRPVPQLLTEFYLWISLGGALGGIFNAFIAPVLFPLPLEFIVVALLSCLINPRMPDVLVNKIKPFFFAMASVSLIFLYGLQHIARTGAGAVFGIIGHLVLLLCLIGMSLSPRVFVTMVALLFALAYIGDTGPRLRAVDRNFFGVSRVYEGLVDGDTMRVLYHGSTIHGLQKVKPLLVEPNGYYSHNGPAGDFMNLPSIHNVAVVGMGAAQLGCYSWEQRSYAFYEIDPAVPALADKWFDFVKTCHIKNINVGDGRRLLAAEQGQPYDMIVLDAFTSDSVPVHLMTKEAIQLYFDHLSPDGVLAFHISNRFYNFSKPLSNIARDLGLKGMMRGYYPDTAATKDLAIASFWLVMAKDEARLEPLRPLGWEDLPAPNGKAWTDDYSNVLGALRMLNPVKDREYWNAKEN